MANNAFATYAPIALAPVTLHCQAVNGQLVLTWTTGTLQAGQRLRIETPGGGGYGRPSP